MKSPKAPTPPDPNVVSQAQTQSNEATAAYNNATTHGNTTTPYGSQTYTPRVDPVTGATVYDQNVSVDPAVQATINAQNQQDAAIANTGTRMLGQIDSQMGTPLDTSGIPAVQGAPDARSYQQSLDTSGLPDLMGANDLLGARQQVQDALYGQQASYLDPQYQQRDQQLRTEIGNKGISEGSEAWRNLMDNFNRDRAGSYATARNSAIAGGGDEMSRLANIALSNRNQAFGERQSAGDFYNQAVGAGNAGDLSRTGFNNSAASQALSQALALRSQPLNELNALRSASQVSVPQFANAQNASVAPADVSGNTWNAYQANLARANTTSQANSGVLGGLFQLGSSALSNPNLVRSDRRLKTDVQQVSTLPNGLPYYEFRYLGDDHKQYGVMADEVMDVMPDAVERGADGYLSVDYGMVLGM